MKIVTDKCIVVVVVVAVVVVVVVVRHSVLFIYSFPTLRSLRPHSIVTNLHIFLSLSSSSLLVAG
jgi:hypothetical protein